jgi:hypothetical protein
MDESFSTTRDDKNRKRIEFDARNPVACWNEQVSLDTHLISICVAPVLVCTKVLQTGGGGDNVSGISTFVFLFFIYRIYVITFFHISFQPLVWFCKFK